MADLIAIGGPGQTTADEAAPGWTLVLRRQPVHLVEGRLEGGYTDAYELVCRDCGEQSRPGLPRRLTGPSADPRAVQAFGRHRGILLGAAGGEAGRRSAARGTVAIGVTSALVNLAVKSAWSRQRPDRSGLGVPVWRNVRMPASTSFPSGHAAVGFAFAAAVGRDQPWLGLTLRFLAAAVAYSRVHTGVHYPGDAVAGALIGEGTGQAVAGLMDRLPPARKASRSGHGKHDELPDAADSEGAPNPETSKACQTARSPL